MCRSNIKVQSPIVTLPSYKKWKVPVTYVDQLVKQLGFRLLYPNGVHAWYSYTDVDGIAKLLPDLLLKSSLYKTDVFTCINYAYKVWNVCAEKYSLNTWVPVIGHKAGTDVRHAWNLIMVGDKTGLKKEDFLFFEPNSEWDMGELEMAYQAFPIGEEGYTGEYVFY